MSLEELKTTLTQFKSDVEEKVSALVKAGSDAANAEITSLKGAIANVQDAIAKTVKEQEKPFGLPGLEYEKKNWSWTRFFQGMYLEAAKHMQGKYPNMPSVSDPWKDAGFEKEVCAQYSKRRDVPSQVLKGTYNSDDGSSGGFLVAPEIYMGDIIEPTYAQTPILSMPGVMKITGLRGDLPVPVDAGNLTAYHLGEAAKPTETSASISLQWLRPKKIGCFVKVSNRLVAYASNAMDTFIREKMSRDVSVKLSYGLTNGKGSEYEPKGILRSSGDMTSVTALGTSGGRFQVDTLAKMKMALAAADELRDTPTYGALMHPNVEWGMLRERTEMYSAQAQAKGAPILPGMLLMDRAKIEAAIGGTLRSTTQVPATEEKGTSSTCSKVIFGDWSKFCFATFRDPIFRVSDVAGDGSTGSAFLDDQLYLVMFLEYDCALLRAAAFSRILDAETTEANW